MSRSSISHDARDSQYRPDIDGLRCIAVTTVVLAHAEFPFAAGGFVGVDVFFVISGYLITSIISRELSAGTYSVLKFYERRARRILPALLVMIAADFAVATFVLSPAHFESMARSAAATVLFGSNIWFFQSTDGYFNAETAHAQNTLCTCQMGAS